MTKDQFKAGDLITIRLTPFNARFLSRGRGSVYSAFNHLAMIRAHSMRRIMALTAKCGNPGGRGEPARPGPPYCLRNLPIKSPTAAML